jgi:radical SAM protein with 4Fe4S-binding SPASM domain
MECPNIPLVSYKEFTDHMHGDLAHLHIPLDCSFEITYSCNLKCAHCYCAPDRTKNELGIREIRNIFDEIADAGCLWILITGGEPLVRPDFLEIYDYAKHNGLIITLFTNGTLLTPPIADHFAEYRPFSIEITLYGITEETYEKVTGVTGSFKRCMYGIELLRERKLPLKLKTTVTTANEHEVAAIRKFADKLGVEHRFDAVLSPRYDGTRAPTNIRIQPRRFVEMEIEYKELAEDWERFCKDFWNMPSSDGIFTCYAGKNACHIDPYGNMQVCIMVKEPSYDLRRGTFSRGWSEFIPRILSLKSAGDSKCKSCEVFPICDRCAGWSLLEKGDMESPIEYLCEIAHLRADAFKNAGRTKERGGIDGKEEIVSEASG